MNADDQERQADAARAEPSRGPSGCARAREALAEACRPCPEREGALRREMLCRCPVALTLRLMIRVERFGDSPEGLTSGERASLDFQERALARRLPPIDREAVDAAMRLSGGAAHAPCALQGCLRCRAARILDELAALPA